ncbi:glycosyltransferase [Tsuneonella suprasediminis]|uniref:glycosyltransferase n=1 Tax=Tsuneonella suprasediminis TaxID=2306996 RepID=UPI002F943F05
MKKVLIAAPYSSLPSDGYVNRFSHLALRFAECGVDTTLATSRFAHQGKRFHADAESEIANLTIKLIDTRTYQSHIGLKRILNLRDFRRNLVRELSPLDSYDLIYSAYPSIGHNLELARRLKGTETKLIVDVQDIWPEAFSSVIPAISKVPPQMIPFSRAANRAYAAADGLVAVSETYLSRARLANPDVPALTAYIGSEFSQAPHTPNPHGPLKLCYIGTLSYSYDIETVMRAVDTLVSTGRKLEFNVYGNGPDYERLRALPVRGTKFHGYIKYADLERVLRNQHIAVNAIRANAPQSVTNKLCDYLSLGCPVMSSQVGDEVEALLASRLNAHYIAGDAASAVDAIRHLIDSPDLLNTWQPDERFDREAISRNIIEFARAVAG